MTVVESLASSVGGPQVTVAAASSGGGGGGSNAAVSSAAIGSQNPAPNYASMDPNAMSAGGNANIAVNGVSGGALNPMAIKAKEEILTSIHLIKDIRRLETYQRDFFLKVRTHLKLF